MARGEYLKIGLILAMDVMHPDWTWWTSPILLVWKKNGTRHICLEYQILNALRVQNSTWNRAWTSVFTHWATLWKFWRCTQARYANKLIYPNNIAEKQPSPPAMGLSSINPRFLAYSTRKTFRRMIDAFLTKFKWQILHIYFDAILFLLQMPKEYNDHFQGSLMLFYVANMTLD